MTCLTDLDFKCEVLLHVLYDHDQERQFYAEAFLRISRTVDVSNTRNINNSFPTSHTLA